MEMDLQGLSEDKQLSQKFEELRKDVIEIIQNLNEKLEKMDAIDMKELISVTGGMEVESKYSSPQEIWQTSLGKFSSVFQKKLGLVLIWVNQCSEWINWDFASNHQRKNITWWK